MNRTGVPLIAFGLLAALGCESQKGTAPGANTAAVPKGAMAKPTAEGAKEFVQKANADLKELWINLMRAEWTKSTYITHDTEILAAEANEKVLGYTSEAIKTAASFNGLELDADTERQLHLLKVSSSLPSPSAADKRKELATIASKMEAIYGKGKFCKSDKDPKSCRDLGQLSETIAKSRKYDELLEAWKGWRTISTPMRPMYTRFIELSNEGAKEIGFENTGELWKSGYDMTAAEFEKETDRLWDQVKPMYEQLHCYVRAGLAKKYGKDKVPEKGAIPAHLLGNMWAQEWMNIYDLVEPHRGQSSIDVTKALKKKKYDEMKMVKMAEGFFTSLGLDKLPDSFWERSMFLKPRDRDVVCHASAWDVTLENDLRIKMCIKVDEEDLITIHHELGHNYYFMYYYNLPPLYQNGAHDGFHEAIGDAIALSVTPGYLQEVGILDKVSKNEKALINLQLKEALDKIAFLPFGKLIDQWRWDVFSGKITKDNYNEAWWSLRKKYQGIDAPVARTETDFDPGAKFHIPANVPYTRYFLARILQFQFHRSMCKAAGHKGPLHECSIYGSKDAGEGLKKLLSMGASKPWPMALEAMTGSKQMDATALLEYFAPLKAWLEKENKGRACGWQI